MPDQPYSRFPAGLAVTSLAPPRATEADPALLRSTTAKRLKPGSPGTRRLLERYGKALLCVRYRIDPSSGRRFTTVELVIEERRGLPAPMVWVRVGYGETDLRQRIKEAGGTWDGKRKLWSLSGQAAKALKLQKRIVKDIQ